MLEAKELSVRLHFVSISLDKPSCEVPAKLFAWRIFSLTFLPFTYTIYTLITHKSKVNAIQRESPRQVSTSQHTYYLRESYLSLSENSLVVSSPSPLSLLYLERRFIPKHNSHLCRAQRVFWSLGSIWDLPKEAGKAWRMAQGGIVGFEKLVKTRLREIPW